MSTVGQVERVTQNRIVKLFQERLGWSYLGNWGERGGRNVDLGRLREFLDSTKKYDAVLIDKAVKEFERVVGDQGRSLYDVNREVYEKLRYGVKVKKGVADHHESVWLIDWEHSELNDFAIAEEVTVKDGEHVKRPDIVLYVNGIALGVLELKRSTVSVAEGIRQNLANQDEIFIRRFFATVQFVLAGNDTEGLRYGTIETKEKYYLTWKEPTGETNLLDAALLQLGDKARFLELIHNFIVFDKGTKKLCRHNQYFGVKAAQERVRRREGGIVWHTQGSGKSLTMVWLAKWILENIPGSRILIITDRTELDEQIEGTFLGVQQSIYRTKSGSDLIASLNKSEPSVISSLVHKFGGHEGDPAWDDASVREFVRNLTVNRRPGFSAKGDIYVFVDECHRTQSGLLHGAMAKLLPGAMFIGFTGTPLLKADKRKSVETFGTFIHTYKFDEAVRDGVVLDLRYEARDIDQDITSPEKIDQWFDAKTRGLNDIAKAQLKERWGTIRKVNSSRTRLERIVADVLMDMETRDRLMSGAGNAMLVSDSVYNACRLYEMFEQTDIRGKCAIVSSFVPLEALLRTEQSGEGKTETQTKYDTYKRMLCGKDAEAFETEVKEKFVKEPGQMKLLIVVDKLLTGFDAPPATYLYIDKTMRDHGLFQAICRVNRLDGDDKAYGYIVDYKDLFKSIARSIEDYTTEAFDAYDKEDVEGLLQNRLEKAGVRLDDALEAVRTICEPVEGPKNSSAFISYFCGTDTSSTEALAENEPRRLSLYKAVAELVRAFASVANELPDIGLSDSQGEALRREVEFFEKARTEVRMASGDYIDLKMYEPAMRHLIDAYIRSEDSEKVTAFDDLSLIQLIVEKGDAFVHDLPDGIRSSERAVAETIENNVRKVIIDERPSNPAFFDSMSRLLDALIEERREKALEYKEYLRQVVELTKRIMNPSKGGKYPVSVNTASKRALFDNAAINEETVSELHDDILHTRQDNWRGNPFKLKAVRKAVARHVPADQVEAVFQLVLEQKEY